MMFVQCHRKQGGAILFVVFFFFSFSFSKQHTKRTARSWLYTQVKLMGTVTAYICTSSAARIANPFSWSSMTALSSLGKVAPGTESEGLNTGGHLRVTRSDSQIECALVINPPMGFLLYVLWPTSSLNT
jgi:hypothetical protein